MTENNTQVDWHQDRRHYCCVPESAGIWWHDQSLCRQSVGLASRAIPVVIGGMRALTVAIMTNPIGLIVGGIAFCRTANHELGQG